VPCYKPLSLKRQTTKRGHIVVPCGHCIGCRLERSRQWAVRCDHERQMSEHSAFITLTYRDCDLPFGDKEPTLVPRDFTLFMKRLRKRYGNGVRFFACGEYGERTRRPHYHACIFGVDFADKVLHSTTDSGDLYSSDTLDDIWGYGHCVIGDVTFESAAYVARYIVDKKTGPEAKVYTDLGIEPEFVRMSRMPGLGSSWYEKYHGDIFPFGRLVVRGVKTRPPNYYLMKLKRSNPLEHEIQTSRRAFEADLKYWSDKDKGAPQLSTKHRVKKAQIKSLTRDDI